jgi:ankyrin repeat protein
MADAGDGRGQRRKADEIDEEGDEGDEDENAAVPDEQVLRLLSFLPEAHRERVQQALAVPVLKRSRRRRFGEIEFSVVKFFCHHEDHRDPGRLLSCAIKTAPFEVVEALLSAGIKPTEDYHMLYAYMYGRADVFELLLEHGAVLPQQDALSVNQAMSRAHFDLARLLLRKGWPLEKDKVFLYMPTDDNVPGLHEMVEELIAAGADVHVGNDLYLRRVAANSANLPMVRFLVEQCKADVNAANGAPLLEFLYYLPSGDYEPEEMATLQYLLDAGADPKLQQYGIDAVARLCSEAFTAYRNNGRRRGYKMGAVTALRMLLEHGGVPPKPTIGAAYGPISSAYYALSRRLAIETFLLGLFALEEKHAVPVLDLALISSVVRPIVGKPVCA